MCADPGNVRGGSIKKVLAKISEEVKQINISKYAI